MDPTIQAYAVRLQVDEPVGERNRLTAAFRIVVAIPILVVLATISGGTIGAERNEGGAAMAGGLLFLGPLLLIVFRQKYPRWWFDWNVALLRFTNRVGAYLLLLRDEYPSTDEQQHVHLDIDMPDVQRDLNRWMPLVKWFLAIPHAIVLAFLWVGAIFVTLIAWFAILFTGRSPSWAFDYVVGVMRWHDRVVGYALVLVTDRYPPFTLD